MSRVVQPKALELQEPYIWGPWSPWDPWGIQGAGPKSRHCCSVGDLSVPAGLDG